MLRFGPDTGPVAVVALPLFEEANRTRAFAVTICRALAKRGVASVLPDLPGQGESLVLTESLNLLKVRLSFAAAVEHLYRETRRAYSVSLRSGAIAAADAQALGRWYLTPTCGQNLVDDFSKVLASAQRQLDAGTVRNIARFEDVTKSFEIAGNIISTDLLRDLAFDFGGYPFNSLGVPIRILRLETDRRDAHRHVPGTPLWRRAEPDNDSPLAALLAEDIADWIAACEG